jgi:NADPH-dependent 2,4-dienoyl-CoA reductase/sulfur reductase-like enzyme
VSHVLIVGASMGGLRTAEALRRTGFQGDITLLGEETEPPYNRPPLSKEFLQNPETKIHFNLNHETLQSSLLLGVKAITSNLRDSTVTCDNNETYSFDYLVAATGLRSRSLQFPNNPQGQRFSLRTMNDAEKLRAAIAPGKVVVILGAGFIGCEMAASLTKLGCKVHVIAPEAIPLALVLGDEFARVIQKNHENHGVIFHMGMSVTNLLGDSTVTGVELSDGSTLDTDIFIEAVGSLTNVEWLRDNDLDLSNGLLVDTGLHALTSKGALANVFAVGDIACFPYVERDLPARRIEHWNIPIEMAKRVAKDISYQESVDVADFDPQSAFRPLASFWSDQFDMHILSYGELHLANSSRLLEGDFDNEFIVGYYRDEELVGVAGLGMRGALNQYRTEISI